VTHLILNNDPLQPFVKIGTIAMGDRHTMRPLQAADMLAYSSRTPELIMGLRIIKHIKVTLFGKDEICF
jgi:hypothetical protein